MKTHYNTPGRTYVRRVATHQYVNVNVNVSCGHVYMYMGAGIALLSDCLTFCSTSHVIVVLCTCYVGYVHF